MGRERPQQGFCRADNALVYEDVDPNGPPAMAAVKNLCWPIGATIRVRFLDGPNPINARIREIADLWTKKSGLANLTFELVPDTDKGPALSSDVRVTLRNDAMAKQKKTDSGHWSNHDIDWHSNPIVAIGHQVCQSDLRPTFGH